MPPNRTTQNRDEKRDEIISAAERLFIDAGYESTSIAALASAAGITKNTIYWYFDDKDAVLLAVLDRVVRQAASDYRAQPPEQLADHLLWLVEVFERMDSLTTTVHARARVSPSVREWHEQFHAAGDALLLTEVRRHLSRQGAKPAPSDEALAAVPRIWSYAIEGMIAHDLTADERRALCQSLVKQLDGL